LELAKAKGWSTGLVATVAVTDASPAAFASHVRDRACQQEIARQYIEVSRPDVVLGGGLSHFQATAPDACGAYGDRIAAVKNTGYAVAFTAPELQAQVSAGNSRILGLFSQDALTPEIKRTAGSTEPHLADMTAAALRVLSKNRKGFFLFVEGSQVDLGNHDNDHGYQYAELIAFDSAVRIVLDWINSNPRRKKDTLLVVVPDHETGGFAVGGYGLPSPQFTPEWTGNKHTGSDVIIWSQGPGSEPLRHGIDNTDVYRALKAALE
jgi:alkaline phosphatase